MCVTQVALRFGTYDTQHVGLPGEHHMNLKTPDVKSARQLGSRALCTILQAVVVGITTSGGLDAKYNGT